jgi:hypothetical protein
MNGNIHYLHTIFTSLSKLLSLPNLLCIHPFPVSFFCTNFLPNHIQLRLLILRLHVYDMTFEGGRRLFRRKMIV